VLAGLAGGAGRHREAARLSGAADAVRGRIGAARFKVYDAGYHASVEGLRDAMGDKDFESAWAEGTVLSAVEAIAYAQRGRGERKRPTSGWESLTPTERDVIRLLGEGLANKDIATRLFVSPRTVPNPPPARVHQTRADLTGQTGPRGRPPHLSGPAADQSSRSGRRSRVRAIDCSCRQAATFA